ncbi:PREDICTED: U4/U6.U5 tri-snRNP-associated protein 1 [Haliaeetus leucocephalus]|uniref:U4/U6.U5 tri-snRNP-associated protein 1 n=1 Tax=Haliaeetus leucocephalus TaxID=52644 RepID=UPI00053CED8E|nr:PREDICTED: U4/U6.U5 tri-snRNP-associated protein 1 [Haliaeetus leucocephalus]
MPPQFWAAAPKAAAAESSLSVEETNKLRAKLGLKPLETTTVKKEAGTKEDPVAADVINPLVQRQREEIREKLAAAKEKRLLNQKLGKIKTLGEDDPWLDDAAAWIERSRKLQQEKELAEKRAKLLEEMDQEFGVSTLVEEEFMRRKRDLYSSRDLQGLTVEHDMGAFREGETLVLTLKDKGVLEESEDVLVNVTLVAEEQAQENAELRKKKPPYVPYEDEDPAAATQGPKEHVVLPKYAEPPQRPSFRLGPGGTQGTTGVAGGGLGDPRQQSPATGPAPQSLELPPLRLAPEYLTPQEMSVTFRKTRRRVRRLRRKEKPLRADDLLPLAPGDTRGDFGSRWALERAGRPSPPGAPDSEGEENVGWSSVNLAEERQHQDFSASSTTILDEEPIVNRGLAAALLLCQNKGLLETTVQKVARVKAPNKSLPSAVYCIEDKMAIDDKYSRREEYRGFTQDFKEKEGYRPDVKIEYVDETGRKLTPKEAFRQLSHRFHGKGSGKMKTERRMKKLDEEALLKKMSSSDTPLGTVALLQEKQKAQKTPYIVLSGSGKSMNAVTRSGTVLG